MSLTKDLLCQDGTGSETNICGLLKKLKLYEGTEVWASRSNF